MLDKLQHQRHMVSAAARRAPAVHAAGYAIPHHSPWVEKTLEMERGFVPWFSRASRTASEAFS